MANITAAEHPKLVLEMTAMERTTPAHYDEWNVRHQQLLDNDKYLNEQCMYTKCRLCADIRYRKGKLVLPKGKEAHLLIEGG